jgi:hypothetical protein
LSAYQRNTSTGYRYFEYNAWPSSSTTAEALFPQHRRRLSPTDIEVPPIVGAQKRNGAPDNTSTLAVLKRRYFNSFIIRKILISIRAIKYEIFIEKEGAKS